MKAWFKHLFIPCAENNFKPNVLERISVGVMLILILLTFAITNLGTLVWIGSDWLVSTILPAVIVDFTNEERGELAVGPLARNAVLDEAARRKAEHMAQNGYFAHYSPDGISPWYWFDQVGYDYVHAGENLAVHFTDSKEVVDAWMRSPLHRDNIVSGNYTEIGVGTAKGEYKGFPTVFVVQLFGTQAAPPALSVTVAEQDGVLDSEARATNGDGEMLVQETNSSSQVVLGERVDQEITVSIDESAEVSMRPDEEELLTETDESNVVPEQILIEEVEESVVVYSNVATSSREGVPLMVQKDVFTDGGTGVSVLQKSATQPHLWLQLIYGVLALFVIVSLILSVVVEWRRQHPVQIAYAGGLLLVMALLLYIHTTLTAGVTIV